MSHPRSLSCTALRYRVTISLMPSTAAEPALSETLSKREVVEYLGKSKRTIEIYIADGRLACEYFNGPNGRTAVFRRAIVEALKRDLDTPMYRATKEAASASFNQGNLHLSKEPSAALVPAAPDPFAGLAAHLAKLAAAFPAPAPVVKPWLTVDEAAEVSGLPQAWLLKQARKNGHGAKCIVAMNVGTEKRAVWRFSREALSLAVPPSGRLPAISRGPLRSPAPSESPRSARRAAKA